MDCIKSSKTKHQLVYKENIFEKDYTKKKSYWKRIKYNTDK